MVTAAPRTVQRSERERWELDRRVYVLRDRGLSYPAIAHVLELYEAEIVSEHQVREWLDRMGFPKNPKKARPRFEKGRPTNCVGRSGWPA